MILPTMLKDSNFLLFLALINSYSIKLNAPLKECLWFSSNYVIPYNKFKLFIVGYEFLRKFVIT